MSVKIIEKVGAAISVLGCAAIALTSSGSNHHRGSDGHGNNGPAGRLTDAGNASGYVRSWLCDPLYGRDDIGP